MRGNNDAENAFYYLLSLPILSAFFDRILPMALGLALFILTLAPAPGLGSQSGTGFCLEQP